MSTTGTLGGLIGGCATALLTVVYWELRALAAQKRTAALKEGIDHNTEKLDQVADAVGAGPAGPESAGAR